MRIMHERLVSVASMAAAAGHADRGSPVLGRIVLVAVAVAAVAAFAVLQVLARSRQRPLVAGRRGPGEAYDWRTLPPADPACDATSGADQETYGPLWRYGVPRGYGHHHNPS
jgi:hypothetical protein